ncbi:MAG: TonB-dependent receptor [Prevotellaceae bacterium]|jgi:TonB-linked SusC/RagA family outer membrane protein|nr:TonB-dependent receptor [Prevotellaceae bacterium]
MNFKVIGFILLMSLCSTIGSAQTKRVTGQVRDAIDGTAIAGATVMVKGSSNGVATDANGEFVLNVSIGDTLAFEMIGKKGVQEVVGQKNVFSIALYNDETQLEEVTVVAFGTQKKASVVSSITTVKPSELRVPAQNFTSALAGRIPGMISYQTSGEPGNDMAQFFVRGVTTFGYQSSPLILIDGFESTTSEMARLQVDDIESFSILKDASATALYGARGANGILLIVTKSGREGEVKVNARVDTHIASPTKMIKTVDGVTYMRMYNEARITRNPDAGALYSEQQIQSTMMGENPMIYPNVDWYDELFKQQTVNTKATVNISGGGQVARYFVSVGFDNENGLLKNDPRSSFDSNIKINRTHLRSNVIFNLTKTTTLDTRIQGEFEKYNGPYTSAGDVFGLVLDSNPVDFPLVYEPDEANRFTQHTLFGSTIVNGKIKTNPYAQMVQGYQAQNNNVISAQATLVQDLGMITEGLKFQAKASVKSTANTKQSRFYFPFYYQIDQYNQVTQEYKLFCLNPLEGSAKVGPIVSEPSRDASYYFEGRVNWDKQFGLHSVSAMVVGTIQEKAYLGSGTLFEVLPERNTNLAGRGTYDYDSRYFFEFGFGYNGSEKFTGKKRYGFFPTAGLAWAVSSEKFWGPIKPVVNNLKLRASYGISGNDAISELKNRFFFLSDISRGGYSGGYDWDQFAGYTWGQTFTNEGIGYTISRYANPDITWEISRKLNLALETAFFNNTFRLTGEYFKEWRSDIYQEREIFAATTGLVDGGLKISGNVGKVEVQGVEFQADFEKSFTKDFWTTGRANFTYSKNKVTAKDEKRYSDKYRSAMGLPVNQMWGLVAERLFVDDAERVYSPRQDWGNYEAGDIKYKDINGDGAVNQNDQIPMGYPSVPEIQYGFGLSMGYKKFDFSFFFQGNARVSFFIDATEGNPDKPADPKGIAPLVNQRNALEIVANDYWTLTNPNVHAFWPRLSVTPLKNNTQASSWWLRDGSFLRLKSIELGYTFKGWEKIAMQSARVYFSSENVFYFSKFKLWDPEMGAQGNRYPPNRRFNIGIQVSF